jgi:hypothetical protein
MSFWAAAQKGIECNHGVTINTNFSKASAIQKVMDRFTAKDCPLRFILKPTAGGPLHQVTQKWKQERR